MDINMACYPLLSFEIRDYYEQVSKGLIEERSYDYWGPDTAEEEAHWDEWWLPIKKSFYPIDWESGFTGRGLAKHKKKAMERPGLVGPMGEMLVMVVDPVSEKVVYRVDSASSEAEVRKRVKDRRRSSLVAASKICKRAKEHFVAIGELRRMTTSMRAPLSHTATLDLVDGIDNYHLVSLKDLPNTRQEGGLQRQHLEAQNRWQNLLTRIIVKKSHRLYEGTP